MPGIDELPDLKTCQDATIAAVRGIFKDRTSISESSRKALGDAISELEFAGVNKSRKMVSNDSRLLLKYRPAWVISTLSVPSRIPLLPGLFDLLVIDEASQCDIASALPLFFRAKRAVVVGDPMQLSFVPGLSRAQEHALMDAAELPRSGRAAIAQSSNSLFNFADKRPNKTRHFLADQFRSAPGIVDYLNEEFYYGRLRGQRPDDKPPIIPGYRPGLEWLGVKGRAVRIDGENVNLAEAATVADKIVELVRNPNFEGTIGALSPFVRQVAEITKEVDARLGPGIRHERGIKISSIDKFQGGEADVIFFSPVITDGAPFGVTSFIRKESKRFNVAVSRARAVCIIVGDLDAARRSEIRHLRRLAEHATRPANTIGAAMDSVWEERLYGALKRRGRDPHPQYEIGRRRLDFALFANDIKLDVEVDGRVWHTDADGNRKVADILRDREMIARGWKVRRFWVSELDRDMEKCLDLIDNDLKLL